MEGGTAFVLYNFTKLITGKKPYLFKQYSSKFLEQGRPGCWGKLLNPAIAVIRVPENAWLVRVGWPICTSADSLPWCAWKWKHWQVEGLVLMVPYRAAMIWTLPPVPGGLGWHSGNVRKKLGWWMGGEQGLETTMGVSRGWWSEALSPIPGTPAAAFSSSPWFILSPSPFILCMKTRVTLWSHLCITSSLLYTFGLCSTALRTKLRVLPWPTRPCVDCTLLLP